MEWIEIFNLVIAILFMLLYAYQYVYLFVACIRKPKTFPAVEPSHRYAIMISARNEEGVIGQLLDSIRDQNYPGELIDAYVVADNCTDGTKAVAEEHGGIVFCRNNAQKIGKGYALDYLFRMVRRAHGKDYYDGYFVIDADNLLDPSYVREMDKCFSAGNRIITSYRNSKNYGDNWISSGYSLWFLHEARHVNNARTLLGTSCAISGTGFLVHKDIINRQGGWKHYLLTEDIEFTIDNVLKGENIVYCHNAMLYDEQPKKFSQSWHQRLRWSKGFLQVIRKHGIDLLKGIFTLRGFAFYDMFFTIAPSFFIMSATILVNLAAFIQGLFNPAFMPVVLREAVKTVGIVYLMMFIVGALGGIYEWKKIHCPTWKKILSFFTFPFFMATYVPISWAAVFTKVVWKPIEHTTAVSLEEVVSAGDPELPDGTVAGQENPDATSKNPSGDCPEPADAMSASDSEAQASDVAATASEQGISETPRDSGDVTPQQQVPSQQEETLTEDSSEDKNKADVECKEASVGN